MQMAKKSNKRRNDNRIAVQVYLGLDPDTHKRKYKTVYGGNQKEADAKAEEIKLALRKGINISPELVTFSDWADRWIRIKKPEIAAARAVVYQSHIKHLKSAFGDTDIKKVRPADVQDVLIKLSQNNPNTGRPMVKETLVGLKSTANQIFQLSIDNRVMDYNPASSVKIPAKDSPTTRRALTDDEQKWIIDTPHRAQLAAMLMLYAGLRRGELIPLTWNDVDLVSETITVSKSVEFIGGKAVLKDVTKTPAGMRTVHIPNRLIAFLKKQLHQSIYICVSAHGKMHSESSWRRLWDSYLADLNIKYGNFSPFEKLPKSKFDPVGVPFVIPKITPHWLRHTFCTMLYFAGVDVLTAMNQMGHSDIKTTLEIYTHLDARHKLKEIGKLNEYLDGASHMQVKSV